MDMGKLSGQYKVLSPWAEVDPKPSRGISPRLKDLSGRKIGLFANYKLAAQGVMSAGEENLKERIPEADFSHFVYPQKGEVFGTDAQAGFEKWISEVDTVILGVGD